MKLLQSPWIHLYLRMYRSRFILIILLGALAAGTAGALMFSSGYLISKASLQPYNVLMIYVPVVGVRAFGIARAVLHYLERLAAHDTILRVLSGMRVRLYQALEPQALQLRSRYQSGNLLGLLSDDIDQLQNLFIRTLLPAVTALLLYGGIVGVLSGFDLIFAFLIACYLLVLTIVMPLLSLVVTRSLNRRAKASRTRLYSKLTDAVLGLKDWLASGRYRTFVSSYERDEHEAAVIDNKLHTFTLLRNNTAQLIIAAAMISVLLWSSSAAADQSIPATWIAAFVLATLAMADVFLPISEAVQKLPIYSSSLSRLEEIEAAAEPAAKSQTNKAASDLTEPGSPITIKLDNISFQYGSKLEPASWQLRVPSLTISQGKRIALLGRSGAGKSTLLKLIHGDLVPTAGSVSYNGQPASTIPSLLGTIVAVLNQRPHLFDATLASNIRLGNPAAREEEVIEVLHKVQLGPLLEKLPQGLHTPMLEAGRRFSGGEGHRIALARILLQQTPIVILDEPTVGLDPRTELALLQTLFEALKGKTILWSTHHLVGVEDMDEILFMEEGMIKLRGSHQELYQTQERYRRLYRLDRPEIFETCS